MATEAPYRFPGITDFIASEGIKPSFAVKIPGLFFVARAVDALSQIPTSDPKSWAEMYAVADEAIAALEASAETIKAARAHVLEACPPPPKTKEEKAADRAEAKAEKAAEHAEEVAEKAAHDAAHPTKHKGKGE